KRCAGGSRAQAEKFAARTVALRHGVSNVTWVDRVIARAMGRPLLCWPTRPPCASHPRARRFGVAGPALGRARRPRPLGPRHDRSTGPRAVRGSASNALRGENRAREDRDARDRLRKGLTVDEVDALLGPPTRLPSGRKAPSR